MNLGGRVMANDRRLLLLVCAVMLLLIVGVSVLAPQSAVDDPTPSTYNSGPQGAKAAYLLLERLGRHPSRWEKPLEDLSDIDAAATTLVLAEPLYALADQKELAGELRTFVERGGRVLTTGRRGAALLPSGDTADPGMFQGTAVCYTTPEGPGELARAGRVEMAEHVQWSEAQPPAASQSAARPPANAPRFQVEQRCGSDAVVVRAEIGKGAAIWWSSPTAMSNAGLKQDADLRLLLASVGEGRAVLFDESLHRETASLWDTVKGLPLAWLAIQTAVLGLLLVISFSRRRGPIRTPVTLPRSSPVEFAESMGDLYEKGGATVAATEAARRRLLRILLRDAGLAQTTVAAGPDAVAEALQLRLGGDWTTVASHLKSARDAAGENEKISARTALALVRSLGEDATAIKVKLRR